MFEVDVAKNLFKDAILSIFPNEHIMYAFLTGPFTFSDAKQDIDIIVVIDDKKLEFVEKEKYLERILKFVEKYLRIHKFLGYTPDLTFPSDVITVSQIEDAINGRGFDIKNNRLYLREIKRKDDYLDPKIDYRVYLWELITLNEGFILGNYPRFTVDSFKALHTVLLFVLSKLENGKFSIRDIKEKMFTLASLDRRYLFVADYIEPMINYVLETIKYQGYIIKEGEHFILKTEKIKEWERGIIKRHKENNWKGTLLFDSWDILRSRARKILEEWL